MSRPPVEHEKKAALRLFDTSDFLAQHFADSTGCIGLSGWDATMTGAGAFWWVCWASEARYSKYLSQW